MGLGPGSSSSGESVVVVMDANRNRFNVDSLSWALNNVVRPKDTVIVLGILCKLGKKNTYCFPFYMGVGISAIWERLEFSAPADKTPQVLEDEIMRKREEYQSTLQPFYRKCKRNEVKLEVKLAAGFCPKTITVEEAQSNNARWIVLDSHLKKDKIFIYGHVGCNIAVMKGSNVATIMPSLASEGENFDRNLSTVNESAFVPQPESSHNKEEHNATEDNLATLPLLRPCWVPLSRKPGFPRSVSLEEVERITNGFDDENIVFEEKNMQIYQGTLQDAPLLVKCYFCDYEKFWSELKILGRVRHRNILNLVGYCCTDDSVFLLIDYPSNGSLDMLLRCDFMAKNLSWKARWEIALAIGGCLRYLHEECPNGPIAHNSICSSHILLSHTSSALLTNFGSAKSIIEDIDGISSIEEPTKYTIMEEELLSIDVHAYGLLLIELITGLRAIDFDTQEDDQLFMDQVLSLLKDDSLSLAMDPRLMDLSDAKEVPYMVSAALLCLKSSPGFRPSMSEVVAVIRGDRFTPTQW